MITIHNPKQPHEHKKKAMSPSADSIMQVNGQSSPVGNDKDSFQLPGQGWSNGDLAPQLFPVTRAGRVQLYGSQRRWIGLRAGWTRIGEGTTELDHRHSTSQAAGPDLHECENTEAQSVRALISQLCEKFYNAGWATGTGGGVSIRVGGTNGRPWRVFVAPSGIQKEDMIGDDIFELDMDRNVVVPPKTPNLRQSACTPLWYVVYKERPSATCVIHTHSMHAQMATLLDPTETSDCFRITHLEMLKGVGHHSYDDVLEVPIIDNRPSEDQLADQLRAAVRKYPKANAVLVRRHGLYCWGDSWEQAKTQCESFDYLFQSAVEMKKMGIDFGAKPRSGTYREDEPKAMEPPIKRSRMEGFNGMEATDNQEDLESNHLPILPRDAKILLLDIEGCTTSIAFVKDTLFPYVRENLDDFLKNNMTADKTAELCEHLAVEVEGAGGVVPSEMRKDAKTMVLFLMDRDIKSAALKGLQGRMWKAGYESGELKGHVYADFKPMLDWMKNHGVDVYIYSSGSIQAQKLLFGNSEEGDLLGYFKGHFDIPTAGNKKESTSYTKIAESIQVEPDQIVFVSDAEAELQAARVAGISQAIMSIRPGNAKLTMYGKSLPSIFSLLQLCGK